MVKIQHCFVKMHEKSLSHIFGHNLAINGPILKFYISLDIAHFRLSNDTKWPYKSWCFKNYSAKWGSLAPSLWHTRIFDRFGQFPPPHSTRANRMAVDGHCGWGRVLAAVTSPPPIPGWISRFVSGSGKCQIGARGRKVGGFVERVDK